MKFSRLVCGLTVCALIAVVYAAPIKILEFYPMNGENENADGVAVINSDSDEAIFHVTITGFQANTKYAALALDEVGDGLSAVIETNPAGNGHGETRGSKAILLDNQCITVKIHMLNEDFSVGEERAVGYSSNCPS